MNLHEQKILDVLNNDPVVTFGDQQFELLFADKPIVPYGGGECKTDIYALYANLDDPKDCREIKISAKKSNAEFFDNKLKMEKAEAIIGMNWYMLVEDAAQIVFAECPPPLIYLSKTGRVQAASMTLGWRLDLVNKPSTRTFPMIDDYDGKLIVVSGKDSTHHFYLTQDQVNPILKIRPSTREYILEEDVSYYIEEAFELKEGELTEEKKQEGICVLEAGIADYVLDGLDNPTSAQQIIDNLVTVEEYAANMGTIYAAFRAVNERLISGKHERSRWLAVQVQWYINEYGELTGDLIFDRPLEYNSNDISAELNTILYDNNILSETDLIPGETIDPDICIGEVREKNGRTFAINEHVPSYILAQQEEIEYVEDAEY